MVYAFDRALLVWRRAAMPSLQSQRSVCTTTENGARPDSPASALVSDYASTGRARPLLVWRRAAMPTDAVRSVSLQSQRSVCTSTTEHGARPDSPPSTIVRSRSA